MRAQLDRTEQRVFGVLIEKELAVPETYPLTLNALVSGCNQKNNRDPIMELEEFQVEGATTSLCLKDWCGRREGSRALKFVHRAEDRLHVDRNEKAVLAELLVRGPQTPMELRTRVVRMGVHLDLGGIADLLEAMAAKVGGGLVELLPRRPRERDARWRHLLGPLAAEHEGDGSAGEAPPLARAAGQAAPPTDLLARLEALEARVAALERQAGGEA